MKGKANGPNWKRIKAEYVSGGISQRALAKKHNVPFGTLQRKARLEKWADKRREVDDKAEAMLIQKTIDTRAEMAELFEKTGLEAIRAIYENFQRFPNGTGTRIVRNLYKGNDDDEKGEKTRAKSKLVPDTVAEHDLKANMDMLAAWAKIYGMDAATRLKEKELQAQLNPFENSMLDDDGFLDALAACSESWEIQDSPANIQDGGDQA